METFEDVLTFWFETEYEIALNQVTTGVTRGDVLLAEELIQCVLARMIRNRITYEGRLCRIGDRVYIQHGGTHVPLTVYVCGATRRHLRDRFRSPQHRQHTQASSLEHVEVCSEENDPSRIVANEELAQQVFTLIRLCLDELNMNQRIALVLRLQDRYPPLQPFFEDYLNAEDIERWQEDYTNIDRSRHLHQGRERLIRCLWERGIAEDLLIVLT